MSEHHVDCPECGEPQTDLWDHNWGSSEEIAVNCGSCGKDYVLSRAISVSYTAHKEKKK